MGASAGLMFWTILVRGKKGSECSEGALWKVLSKKV